MFLQLPKAMDKLKRSTYYANGDLYLEDQGMQCVSVSPEEMETLIEESLKTYDAAIENLSTMAGKEDMQLVSSITTAIVIGLPSLSNIRMQHALFTKRLYQDGEITFERFITKMTNMFPNRMQALPHELRDQIAGKLNN